MERNRDLDKLRPTCVCGHKMVLIEYVGYYDGFSYWECHNEECEGADYEDYTADDKWFGGYV